LNLDNNQLTELPEAIGKLTNLTELYLFGNQMTNLPEAIEKLANLTVLGLSNNQLTNLPEAIGKLANLTKLYLRDNQFQTRPVVLDTLHKITRLELDGNPYLLPSIVEETPTSTGTPAAVPPTIININNPTGPVYIYQNYQDFITQFTSAKQTDSVDLAARIRELEGILDRYIAAQDITVYQNTIEQDWLGGHSKLDEASLRYLSLGLFYQTQQENANIDDFSATVLCFGKAVENELTRSIIKKVKDLKKITEKISENEVYLPLKDRLNAADSNKFTLGNLYFLFKMVEAILIYEKDREPAVQVITKFYGRVLRAPSANSEMASYYDVFTETNYAPLEVRYNDATSIPDLRNSAAHGGKKNKVINATDLDKYKNAVKAFITVWNKALK
jgi:hypothetical protein